jgi:phosphoglycolate phosphatase
VTVVLFDIDGTLIRTGRAGSRAMDRAFEEIFGIARAFDGIQMAGRTDKWILDDAAARAGVALNGSSFQRFRKCYFDHLRSALDEPDRADGTRARRAILPGVGALLDALTTPPFSGHVFPALLTGNCEEGARIKLQHFDLWRYFRCGAFGDDVHDRNELFAVAMERVRACGGPPAKPHDVIVVGDTPLDVACAAAAGARSVGVATGPADARALEESGADVVFDDLRDTEAFLKLVKKVQI